MFDKKIIVFSYYFGKLPEQFGFFAKTVEHNPSVDFIIVTDDKIEYTVPGNLKIVDCSFAEAKERIQKLFPDFEIVLDRPYKLCDYKPVWGLAFPEYLEGYDFWGYCDLDLLFGDIRSFITDDILDNYEKIYKLGHLTLYRNNDISNSRFKLKAENAVYYIDAFTTPEIAVFDEIAGMQNIYDSYSIPTYKGRDYADITWGKVQFTLSYFQLTEEQKKNNNYEKQLFYWENGKVFRAYVDEGEIKTDEFVYIHFSKRKMSVNDTPLSCNSFFITNRGLFAKDADVCMDDFDKYNPYEPEKEKERQKQVKKNAQKDKIKYYKGILKRKLGL